MKHRARSSVRMVILAGLCGLLAAFPPAALAARPGGLDRTALPPIASADGSPLPISALRGKVVLVNFWASWCVPCRKELPSLDRLAATRPDLVVIAASVDTDRADGLRAFAGRYSHLRLGFSTLQAVQRFGALGMPYSIILDGNGREKRRVPRALAWDGPEGAAIVRRP